MSQGTMFAEAFLSVGIQQEPEYAELSLDILNATRAQIQRVLADFPTRREPNEADTETDAIEPLLALLGWQPYSKRPPMGQRRALEIPDYVLFSNPTQHAAAVRLPPAQRVGLGLALLEAKRWNLPLDYAFPGEAGAPSTQIIRYLSTADVQSNGSVRFGILTNGKLWRLYDGRARARLEAYVEIDLEHALADDHVLKLFLLLFQRTSFVPNALGQSALSRWIAASREYESLVTESLAGRVFDTLFEGLARAIAAADPARPAQLSPVYLSDLREASLLWLYRLLFLLYAEDRRLLPTREHPDGLWSLRQRIAQALDQNIALSATRTSSDQALRALWSQVSEGDRALRIPPYNGGLFSTGRSPLLDRTLLPDAAFAPILDGLSREGTEGQPRFVNYRDLSVQHLGSIYERLLEYELTFELGAVMLRPQPFARKTSGSYYTPDDLVMLVIRRTVGPLIEERLAAFREIAGNPPLPITDYEAGLLPSRDPAAAILAMRIVDPAMGSGHFLVSLVDYLADRVLEAAAEAADLVPGYRSPILDRLEAIRAGILENAAANDWDANPELLVDRLLVRRIILKSVVYGVDKNAMTVELAKLSLWLHTFTVGAPLSFLDHHLQCGDSLFGEWAISAIARIEQGRMLRPPEIDDALAAITDMQQIEELSDADIDEVHESAARYRALQARTGPALRLLSLLQGYRWIEDSQRAAVVEARRIEQQANRATGDEAFRLTRLAWDTRRRGAALDTLLSGELGNPLLVIDQYYGRVGQPGGINPREGDDPAAGPLIRSANIARLNNFFHWEFAFLGVWQDFLSPTRRTGGFDAVIGNPPWDRLKMQEVEWFAARRREIAAQPRAEDRKRMIRALQAEDDSLASEYEMACEIADLALARANKRDAGDYPMLGRGDVNLYSLFVEQAQRLVRPGGLVGLLTPSGIYADLGASRFFRSISTTGRLGALLDYANRPTEGRIFFPDVDSRFNPSYSPAG